LGGECSTIGRDEKCIQNLSENLKGRDDAEDVSVDGRIRYKPWRRIGGVEV